MDLDLTPLVTEIAALTTVREGFEAFIDKAVAELEMHKDDPEQVQAVADQFRQLREQFGAALVRGTAAVTEPTPEQPPVEEPPVTEPVVEEPVLTPPDSEPITEPVVEGGNALRGRK